jgi:hypothetical protein
MPSDSTERIDDMKFWIGFLLGATVSGFVIATIDDDERQRLARRVKQAALTGRSGEIASSVSDGVGGIADVATDRVTTAVETATSKVAETLEDTGSSAATSR